MPLRLGRLLFAWASPKRNFGSSEGFVSEATYGDHVDRNPNPLMRFSHGARFEVALAMADPRPGDRIFDVGAGSGAFIAMARDRMRGRGEGLAGLEVWEQHRAEAVERLGPDVPIHTDWRTVPSAAFTKATCLETLEHVVDWPALFAQIRRILTPDGELIVSVPIEVGPVSLVKNIVRWATRGTHGNSGLANVLRAAFYAPSAIHRAADGGSIGSHVGFDHRRLPEAYARAGFAIVETRWSPLPLATHLVNSQLFHRLRVA